ncbi:hypothetical protein QOL99_07025 [Deinococcus sp. MIMF12]|uniref:Restriction endonuclease n=1 Tax=Deinococcus rhizophilus TaxID=3049544 RepID=A0ABT7JFS7_9DEIO|nr:hypothetical protein [Deinococcus rhizophilus]MDL2343900.1 hypothetical protein [Deinococcus rhizophilus]
MTAIPSLCADIFIACCEAMNRQDLLRKRSASDKEFFFQDWMRQRLAEVVGDHFSDVGRNGYPDFVLSGAPEGYELKGLALPGRKTIDSNSRFPQPVHQGRRIYYVFGRYPQTLDLNLGLSDLLICHASFINAHSGEPRNRSFLGYGSYGDLLLRDRKMYVFPLPFYTAHGTAGNRTLILPAAVPADDRLVCVGELVRREVDQLVAGYSFEFGTDTLTPRFVPNPAAGQEHRFRAYRMAGQPGDPVTLEDARAVLAEALAEGA